jgi:hypothetical protein
MNLEKIFDEVDTHGKAALLWEHGELLTTIDYYNQKVRLYLLDQFYVELYYNPRVNKIVKITKSDAPSLSKFLKEISIE